MIRALLLPMAVASSTAFAQLAPGTRTALIDHLREVNAEWYAHSLPTNAPISFNSDSERIAMHLRLVREHLEHHTPEGLNAQQTAERISLLNALEEYADAGRFPQNYVLPRRNPIFIDPHNTACAVGQLMIVSGHGDLAERIDAEMETAYIREMKWPEIADWATAHGFTSDELAWIQPGYGPNIPWMTVGSGTNGEVSQLLTLADGGLLVAGQFTEAGGAVRNHVAKWNGTSYEALGSLPDGVVNAAIEFEGVIHIGGSFNNGTVDLLTWSGTSWTPSTAFPGKTSAITAFHVYFGALYAAGSRDGFAGTDHFVAYRSASEWQMVGQVLNGPIHAFATLNDDLYIGGEFTGAFLSGGNEILHVARMGDASWGQVGDGLNGTVNDLLVHDDKLYATGAMVSMLGASFGLARIAHNAPTWEQLMPNITNYIIPSPVDAPSFANAMVAHNGDLYITGAIIWSQGQFGSIGVIKFGGEPDEVSPYGLDNMFSSFIGEDIELIGNQLIVGGAAPEISNIMEVGLTTGITEPSGPTALSIMPNPVVDQVLVKLPEGFPLNSAGSILDARGRTVAVPVQRVGGQLNFDTRDLAAGSYWVELNDGRTRATGRFVKN